MAHKKQDNHSLRGQSICGMSSIEGSSQDLLPGIPNDITLDNITPKLAWRDLYLLSTVSRAWCQANRSRQVYTARVRQDCLETLVLIDYSLVKSLEHSIVSPHNLTLRRRAQTVRRRAGKGAEVARTSCNGIALYSIRDNSCSELPPVLKGGFPTMCQFVSLDGNIYVLGGRTSHPGEYDRLSGKVYVLDLVGQGQWQRCAHMIRLRENFECVVMDGKIFVFEGSFRSGGEVYDPKENTWYEIGSTTIYSRFPHSVEIVGEVFVVHDEISFIREVLLRETVAVDEFDLLFRRIATAFAFEVAEDDWRVTDSFWTHCRETALIFIAHRKLHRMSRRGPNQFCIEVLDADGNAWTDLHSFTFDAIGFQGIVVKPCAVLAVNDELLAVVSWCNKHGGTGFCLLQSKGLRNMAEEICWQKAAEVTFSLKDPLLIYSLFETNISMCALKV